MPPTLRTVEHLVLTSGKALEKSWVYLYEQLSGHEATFDNAEGEVCLSATKRPRKGTLLKIVDKVSIVKGKVSIPHEIAKALQCSYAKVVGVPLLPTSMACAGCNRTWRTGSESCPLCNTSTPKPFEL